MYQALPRNSSIGVQVKVSTVRLLGNHTCTSQYMYGVIQCLFNVLGNISLGLMISHCLGANRAHFPPPQFSLSEKKGCPPILAFRTDRQDSRLGRYHIPPYRHTAIQIQPYSHYRNTVHLYDVSLNFFLHQNLRHRTSFPNTRYLNKSKEEARKNTRRKRSQRTLSAPQIQPPRRRAKGEVKKRRARLCS